MDMPILEKFNESEEFLYVKPYVFIKGYALGKNLSNTLIALPLARRIHDGQYRKGLTEVNGQKYKLPYILHCLKVCSTLISLNIPFSNEELDIMFAAALLHDSLEDGGDKIKDHGREFVEEYGLDPRVLEIVKLLSKNAGASEEELSLYFNKIKRNKLALLIKLADRSHNVEDLYNMKIEKLHKYVKETRTYIYPLAKYGKEIYPELSNALTILKSKIVSLTELTETICNKYEEEENEKDKEIQKLKDEIEKMKAANK